MRLTVIDYADPAPRHVRLAGPADLFKHGAGSVLTVHAPLPSAAEQARWAYVLGLYVFRGGEIRWAA